MKISTFIIGLILVSSLMGIIGLISAEVSQKYNSEYDNSYLNYSEMDALIEHSEEIKNKVASIKEKEGILDVIGGYFSSAIQSLILTKKSYDLFDKMTDEMVEDAELGPTGPIIRNMVGTIMIIVIFLGVIVSAMVKKDI